MTPTEPPTAPVHDGLTYRGAMALACRDPSWYHLYSDSYGHPYELGSGASRPSRISVAESIAEYAAMHNAKGWWWVPAKSSCKRRVT